MSEHHLRPSVASDILIVPPWEIVELSGFVTRSGEPARVKCKRLDRLKIVRVLNHLPGGRERLVEAARKTSSDEALDQMDEFRPFGERLIEIGTAFEDESGADRQAFWATVPIPATLPASALDSVDFMKLVHTLMRLGGFIGGAADEANFPAGKPDGEGDGERAVEDLEGAGSDAAGSPGAPGSGVHGHGLQGERGVEAAPAG